MEMVNKSGGTNELLRTVSPYTNRTRIAQIAMLGLGFLTYFDPYASILMMGKVFGSVLKGFPISSEKLSFLADTAALPISSLIPGSTWMVLAATALQKGLDLAPIDGESANDLDAKSLLAKSIKYQIYPVLILAMTALQMVLSREAGTMLRSENGKRSNYGDEEQELETALSTIRRSTKRVERSWNWLVPVFTLNIVLWITFLRLEPSGGMRFQASTISSFVTSVAATIVLTQLLFLCQPKKMPELRRLVFWRKDETRLAFLTDTFPSGSSSYVVTMKSEGHEEQHIDADFGDIIESPKVSRRTTHEIAVDSPDRREKCLKCVEKLRDRCVLSPTEAMECLSQGVARSLPMVMALLCSWTASEVYTALGFNQIAIKIILNENLATEAIPTVAFFAAFLLSLVLGSSWATVSVLLPTVSMSLLESDLFTLIVGSVLSGSVAGDHIGPFSETSILSSFTTDCDVHQHFTTQAPYALSILLLSVVVGTVPLSFGAFPEAVSFVIGIFVICIAVICVCRRVQNPKFVPGRASEAITQEMHSTRSVPNDKYLPEGMIMPVSTDDLIDKDEDQTVGADEEKSNKGPNPFGETNPHPMIPTHTLQSFKSKLQEVNSGSGDPILGLVADGLLPGDISKDLKPPPQAEQLTSKASLAKVPRDPNLIAKRTTFESKKKLIEATIKSSENDGNIFSESLRMFLRTAETKLDQIMSEGNIDLKATESNDSDDDSLDHLMMDIATKGWKSAVDIAGKEDDVESATGEGYTTTGGYTTSGDYTTDGGPSILEDSDDFASASSASSSGRDGRSTAFTTDGENQSTSTSNGPSISESEGTQGAEEQMRSTLMNPLAFHKSHQVFAWMNGSEESQEDTETDTAYGSSDPSKASF